MGPKGVNLRTIWVIKVGSRLLHQASPGQFEHWMQQVASESKVHFVWVSSGAIATGAEIKKVFPKNLVQKQALSALGQPLLIGRYIKSPSLRRAQVPVGQILLSPGDLRRKESRQNFINTVHQLWAWHALPVLNENDAVATEEIRFGDNDQLSAQVAVALRASRLLLLSHVDGVLDRQEKVIPEMGQKALVHMLAQLKRSPPQSANSMGWGGIVSKLQAARTASLAGVDVEIRNGISRKSWRESSGTLIKRVTYGNRR